ncbi:glycosyl hydrolase family 61-domain-containing protein [Triangularia setosa]|uniref:lytic cellulose monooxygenase (C4-dehydrogenating) n=1 Tax=Triangularia setosa TaxID=2587417 RepID=A0AAN7A4X1_9PEZI|nr:glycosyl hydrolase family 61-domain-containing protein [Podospora setosa]
MSPLSASVLLLGTAASTALAHSHLAHILVNGVLYNGFDPRPNVGNYDNRIGWSSSNTDDGYVGPADYASPEIICHKSGAPPLAHAPVKAGEKVHVQWNGWPIGHVGPVLAYIAPCLNTANGCGSVAKTNLRWTKLDDSNPVLLPGAPGTWGSPAGKWATDVMIAQNNSWQVEIPHGLKPGPYVLRHEIIALHFARDKGGAQNYPVCMNLWVEPPASSATAPQPFKLDNFDARGFYKDTDKGILIDVSTSLSGYVVPGPTMAPQAKPVPHVQQQMMLSRADGTPVVVVRSTATQKWTPTARAVKAKRTGEPVMKGRYYRD